MAPLDYDARVNERRALLIVVVVALPIGVVAGLFGLLGGLPVALAAFVAVTVIMAGWLWFTADTRVVRTLGGGPADPVRHARLINMVDGVCSGVGVNAPRLVVVDDPALNTLAAGRHRRRAILAVTTGLLDGLHPIELEGVVAEQLVRIRRRDTLPLTLALPLGAVGVRLAGPKDDTATDLVAVSVTRYPPGLAAALEAMAEGGTALARNSKVLTPLWMANPNRPPISAKRPQRPRAVERADVADAVDPGGAFASAGPGLLARAEALREL